jgi:glutamine synthetase
LTHGGALLALTNPSTNSFKRLVPGFEAPVKLFFSLANRSAAIRIPKYAQKPEEKRMEFRPPDATCNVYLALAAQLMAGIDGIKKKIDPTKAGFGPIDENVFALPPKERDKIASIPTTLKETLDALREDHRFLLEGGVFTKDILDVWIDYKLNMEYNEVRNRPHPYEISLYYDV